MPDLFQVTSMQQYGLYLSYSSLLIFLLYVIFQVEFVEGDEQFVSFSGQPSADFEHEVSPLDPNMSSAACYSPVYAKNIQFYPQASDICVSSSTGPVDEQQAMEFLDEKKLVMDGKASRRVDVITDICL